MTCNELRDVADTYRRLRRRFPARVALALARYDLAAERAGLSRWPGDDIVTIDGREYAVTLEPDPGYWRYGDDDVTGRLIERRRSEWTGHPEPVEAPAVALDERRAYEPGPSYDPDEHLAALRRDGWAKGPSVVERRRELLADAAPHVAEADYGEPRCWIVTVERDGESASLGGVELVGDGEGDRSYVWEVVQDLAAEIDDAIYLKAARRTCHA